jgi:D-beta-D-heptose 7-phosphate kinase / D-beta-D-heptose 1-phosphate adenosyltransferase
MENSYDTIAVLEARWNGKHMLVVGDVMLDKYIHGVVERISPEAPVPVVQAVRRSQCAGGAANVAMNVVDLKARATLIGFTGTDDDEVQLRRCLLHTDLKVDLISIPGTSTTSKLRILGGGQQMIRLDVESTGPHPADAYAALLRCVEGALPEADGVILSDYAKGVLTEEVCRSVIESARTHSVPVFVDPKNADFSRYRDATAICPNLKELALAVGRSPADLSTLLDRGQKMVRELNLEYMIVTMGERGITVLHEDERTYLNSVAREIFDVSGAGDTVIATLSLAICCDVPVRDAAQLANVAAGIVVSKQGTVPVGHEELVAALAHSFSNRRGVLQEAD